MSQAAAQVTAALPAIPPSSASPYTGSQATAAARAALQRALDNYKTGYINLPTQSREDIDQSDTRSFAESHATELSYLDAGTAHSEIINTPPIAPSPLPQTTQPISDQPNPSPINPSNLNQSPTPIPAASSPAAALDPTSTVPTITPTVAETGIPVSAGPDGPGPATGSLHDLHDLKAPISDAAQKPAEPSTSTITAPQERHETAEEEKKRLEREERERILAAGGSNPQQKDDDELPPYQE